MKKKKFEFLFTVFNDINELDAADRELLIAAQQITQQAYAKYSEFYVGAAARLANGKIVTGTNQENASYPVGICAERVLLSAVSSIYPGTAIESIAISYKNMKGASDHPISPCGMCRQSLQEFEGRMGNKVRLILSGMEGEIYIVDSASQLLPLAFTSKELDAE